ncbi:MAG TPA: DEAD/DEAH box helicase family protein [Tepidisphaeraceae bacterium]|jgi:superfamily II DNA or RNA helicase|nr:DEAD/DEAH box helicase family protein [Tepidisphaeraceae bacterium]
MSSISPSSPAPPSAGIVSLSFDQGTLLIRGMQHLPPGVGEVCTWDPRTSAWRCLAVEYVRARDVLRREFGERFHDHLRPPPRISWPAAKLPLLRPEQRDALAAWENAGSRGLVIMPTGTGKTEVALAAMERSRVSTLVVAPVRDLMHQWHQRILRRLGYNAGIIGDNIRNLQPVTVTTYDSAYIHMGAIGDRFGLVIFDEAHHLPGRSYREAAQFCAAPLRLGLTATPERADGRDADFPELIGPIVCRQEISQARGKSLAEYEIVRIPVQLDPAEQAAYDSAGRLLRSFLIAKREEEKDYGWEDLCAESGKDPEARKAQNAFYTRKSIEDRANEKLRVLEDLFRVHVGERVIVFAGSNAMAMDISRRFLVPTLLNHSRKAERRTVLEGFARGDFPVLVANQVLDEGVDVPEAKIAVVIGGFASTRQAKQRLGRILRKSGNTRATLYEVVCQDTNDEQRSRSRRRSDAYVGTKRKRSTDGRWDVGGQ